MKGLMKVLHKSKRGKAGFTLIELMIVIIIVGVLAAAAVPIYSGFVKRAYLTEAKSVVGAIRTAELVYHAEMDVWLVPIGGDEDYPDTKSVLTRLGIEIDKNRWFNLLDQIFWVTWGAVPNVEYGMYIIGDTPPVDDLGAQINFDTGVIETTSGTPINWIED